MTHCTVQMQHVCKLHETYSSHLQKSSNMSMLVFNKMMTLTAL